MREINLIVRNNQGNAFQVILHDTSLIDKIKFCFLVLFNKGNIFFIKDISLNMDIRNKEIQKMIKDRNREINKLLKEKQ